ncbi:unnamed protein product [Arabidopsis halleri]
MGRCHSLETGLIKWLTIKLGRNDFPLPFAGRGITSGTQGSRHTDRLKPEPNDHLAPASTSFLVEKMLFHPNDGDFVFFLRAKGEYS